MLDTRALLLTDVVDSTQLSQSLGDDAMAEVWARHDRVARDLLPPWRGREIDKTDGMLLLFEQAADAVHYAQAYHRAIGNLPQPLVARAGLHVGPVILRENSADDVARGAKPLEVDGMAKPTAARIMAVAQGGQTLLSAEAAAALAEPGAAEPTPLRSHGHWMMKGVEAPVELFELEAADAPLQAPTDGDKAYRVVRDDERWLPVREIPNNLPLHAARLIGRHQELHDIKAVLGRSRLVTLLGMGGMGKTRLALQAASELVHTFPEGVWFLDLAPISDPAMVVTEAAQVLGVRDEPERSLMQSVCAHLQSRRVLMVLDNCEHLIQAVAELAHAIVKAAPKVRLLSSSRESLRVPGEQNVPIAPLSVPRAGDGVSALRDCAAVRLFIDRAQAQQPAFALTEANAAAVGALVARLEGIPLALELAAARIRLMSVADINRRLDDRYKVLTGGARTLQQRQQTLRALVDWSYDLLPDAEKTLLCRLAVFRGGFDMDAAEAVCGREPLDPMDVMDGLGALIEKSLLTRDEQAEPARYRALETIREYALEKLKASGEADATAAAHALHYFEVAKQGHLGLNGPKQGAWLARLEEEQDNFRSAIALALTCSGVVDAVLAVKFATQLQNFWVLRGRTSEGRAIVDLALALPVVAQTDAFRAHALYVQGVLAWSQSDHATAMQALSACLELRRMLGLPKFLAGTLLAQALTCLDIGNDLGAQAAAQEALQIFCALKDPVNEALARLQLGQIALFRGALVPAADFALQALALAKRIQQPDTEAETELLLGQIAFEAGEWSVAAPRLGRSLQICLGVGDRRGAANARGWQGRLALAEGRLDDAAALLAEALQAYQAFAMRGQLLGVLDDVARLLLRRGQPAVAQALVCAADELRQRAALPRAPFAQLQRQNLQAELDAAASGPPQPAQPSDEVWDTETAVRQALAALRQSG